MMGSKAFESPLIPHARMRALYRALVEARLLSASLPGRSAAFALAKGREACWVGTAIDLKPGDLTSEPVPGALIQHIIRIGERQLARAASLADIKKTRRELEANPAIFPGSSCERMLCAIGQAMALKAAAAKGVVVAYVPLGDLSAAEWRRVFTTARPDLPLIFVAIPGGAIPGGASKVDLERSARAAAGSAPVIPVIPVDAGDAVALYRVTQESIGRARAEGGVVVIECVPFGVDPIKLLRSQLIRKGICTETWANAVEASFRNLLRKP